jgi:hypothetical protein
LTNLKGVRVYRENSGVVDNKSYAYKDVSSLAIVAPFSITWRLRTYHNAISVANYSYPRIRIKYGGASDDLYSGVGMYQYNVLDQMYTWVNYTDTHMKTAGSAEAETITYTSEAWGWMQLDVDIDRNLTVNYKADTGTTKPVSWDETDTHSIAINATPAQVLQEIAIEVRADTNIASTHRVIHECDELYLEQN